LHLVEQAGRGWLVVGGERLGQLGDEFAFGAGELLGDLHQHLHDEIAAAFFVHVGNAAPADAQLLAALRTLGNLEGDRAVDAGHLNLSAQRCLWKADGYDAVQVLAIALEEVVSADGEHDIQIAAGTARAARVAFAGAADAGSMLDARRHFDIQRAFGADARLTSAGLAGIANNRAPTAASAAGAGHGEETLLIANLAPALALGAGRGAAAGGAATALAVLAGLKAAYLDLGVHTEKRVLPCNAHRARPT